MTISMVKRHENRKILMKNTKSQNSNINHIDIAVVIITNKRKNISDMPMNILVLKMKKMS